LHPLETLIVSPCSRWSLEATQVPEEGMTVTSAFEEEISYEVVELGDGEGSNLLLLRDTVLGAESTTSPCVDL
jgi:hypothetical protein